MIASLPCELTRSFIDEEGATRACDEAARLEVALVNESKHTKPKRAAHVELACWGESGKVCLRLPLLTARDLALRLIPIVQALAPPPPESRAPETPAAHSQPEMQQ